MLPLRITAILFCYLGLVRSSSGDKSETLDSAPSTQECEYSTCWCPVWRVKVPVYIYVCPNDTYEHMCSKACKDLNKKIASTTPFPIDPPSRDETESMAVGPYDSFSTIV
mmetsp:Transcript_2451/g.4179  ORF Transcript_2451/g.4179 Transcript_2451/m.4179 type:complete len:110 (-) Transcript_2451:104-433(-)